MGKEEKNKTTGISRKYEKLIKLKCSGFIQTKNPKKQVLGEKKPWIIQKRTSKKTAIDLEIYETQKSSIRQMDLKLGKKKQSSIHSQCKPENHIWTNN